jgi:hypothetical protein
MEATADQSYHTIANLDLDSVVSFCDVLDTSYDFRHDCDFISPDSGSKGLAKTEMRS